jgi:hypothetical protein
MFTSTEQPKSSSKKSNRFIIKSRRSHKIDGDSSFHSRSKPNVMIAGDPCLSQNHGEAYKRVSSIPNARFIPSPEEKIAYKKRLLQGHCAV